MVKLRTQKDIQMIFDNCKKMVASVGLQIADNLRPDIVLSSRLKTHPAVCWKYNKNKFYKGIYQFEIRISSHIIQSDQRALEEILLHELVHTVKGCFDHGAGFKKACKLLNDRYGYDIARSIDFDRITVDDSFYTYRLICPSCGSYSYLTKKPAKNRIYYCKRCMCDLITEKLK